MSNRQPARSPRYHGPFIGRFNQTASVAQQPAAVSPAATEVHVIALPASPTPVTVRTRVSVTSFLGGAATLASLGLLAAVAFPQTMGSAAGEAIQGFNNGYYANSSTNCGISPCSLAFNGGQFVGQNLATLESAYMTGRTPVPGPKPIRTVLPQPKPGPGTPATPPQVFVIPSP